jgi:hypothetical protein
LTFAFNEQSDAQSFRSPAPASLSAEDVSELV